MIMLESLAARGVSGSVCDQLLNALSASISEHLYMLPPPQGENGALRGGHDKLDGPGREHRNLADLPVARHDIHPPQAPFLDGWSARWVWWRSFRAARRGRPSRSTTTAVTRAIDGLTA